eukprot:GHRQ01023362.1.p2 GENE.GHRQ01023362.1~~GHRQ01023362.1.p2  ORF type:complete len:123 (+),score=12.07 GHRQ01023362.1:1063-1431(+)
MCFRHVQQTFVQAKEPQASRTPLPTNARCERSFCHNTDAHARQEVHLARHACPNSPCRCMLLHETMKSRLHDSLPRCAEPGARSPMLILHNAVTPAAAVAAPAVAAVEGALYISSANTDPKA